MLSSSSISSGSEKDALYAVPLESATLTQLLNVIPQDVYDTLNTYFPASTVSSPEAISLLLSQLINTYLTQIQSPQDPPSSLAPSACEICLRDWIPLTAHHLIPRSTHAKALKRGWHPASDLNNLAYLCRACHSFVHRIASNEDLAREWYTVERIMERDDVKRWSGWAGRVRWKKR